MQQSCETCALYVVFQEGVVVSDMTNPEVMHEIKNGLVRILIGPPSSKNSTCSRIMDRPAAELGTKIDDSELGLLMRVHLTSLQPNGFTCSVEALLSEFPDPVLLCPHPFLH